MSQNEPENRQGEHEEDWWEHRRRRHGGWYPGLFWGLLLILIGILVYANNEGWLHGDWWQYFLIGLGGIFIIESAVRYFSRRHPWGDFGRLIAGVILLFIGLAFLYGVGQWWPLVLIVVGVVVLLGSFLRRGRPS